MSATQAKPAFTPEEQADNRRLWVEALRSGKYAQGRLKLRSRDDRYCCLGVACDLLTEELGLQWVNLGGCIAVQAPGDEEPDEAGLPKLVREAYGLRTTMGETRDDSHSLYVLNDNGKSFLEIADVIENPPAGLLVAKASGTEGK